MGLWEQKTIVIEPEGPSRALVRTQVAGERRRPVDAL